MIGGRPRREVGEIHAAQRSSTRVVGCLRIRPHGLNTASTNAMSRTVGETIGRKIRSPTASEADSPAANRLPCSAASITPGRNATRTNVHDQDALAHLCA
jgi:hypothetical protein